MPIFGLESGAHNADLEKSATRILQGGTWKDQSTVMIIPAGSTIPTKVYLSHCGLIFPPNNGAFRMAAIGMEVGQAFSNAIEEVLAHPILSNYKFILTIEHDNIPPQDGLIRLIEKMENNPEFSWISGSYWTKGVSGVFQAWGDINDPVVNFRPQPPKSNRKDNLLEVYGTGMGFCLWRMSMFKDKKLKRPLFKTQNGSEGKGVGTQDLMFAAEARKHGYRCAVDLDVKVGHYDLEGKFGPPDMVW